MATLNSLKTKIQGLIDLSNEKTGRTDTDLTASVNALAEGYGQGEEIPEYDGEIIVEGEPSSGGTGGDLTINGIIKEYQVNAGASVSAGDFVEFIKKVRWSSGTFANVTATYITACKLSDDKVFVAYIDSADGNYGKALVMKIADDNILIGETVVFNSSTTRFLSSVALDEERVCIVYRINSSSPYILNARVLTINETTITTGTATTVCSGSACGWVDIALWYENTVLVCYSNNNQYGTARVLSISGTTITLGAAKEFYSKAFTHSKIAILNGEKAIVVGRAISIGTSATNGYGGGACVLSHSGTTIYAGTVKAISSNDISAYFGLSALSESKVIVAYGDDDNSSGIARILSISGTAITLGAEYVFCNTTALSPVIETLDNNRVFITYIETTGRSILSAILTINDTEIITNPTIAVMSSSVTYSYHTAIPIKFSNYSIVVFSHSGTYCGLTIDGTTISKNEDALAKTFVQPATSNDVPVGVAKTAGADGETVQVYRPVE